MSDFKVVSPDLVKIFTVNSEAKAIVVLNPDLESILIISSTLSNIRITS